MADAAEKASPEEEEQREDVRAMDERDEAKEVAEQEENVLLPLLKSMFPHVSDKVIAEVMEASGGDGDMAIDFLMTVGGSAAERGSSGSVAERTDRLTAAYAWQDPQVVEEPDFDPSIDAPFLQDVPHSPTIVSPYGEHGGRCGYCNKSATGRISWGMTAIKVRIDDYEAMQDLGWTRSGTWMYHPSNDKACCPQYVIRLDVAKFVPSKEQKHVLAKMERFLSDINNTPENFRHHQHGRTDANAIDEHERGRESEGESEDEEVDETLVNATQPESIEPQLKDNDDTLKKALLADIVHKAVRRCVAAGEIPAMSGGADVEVAISAGASERERKRRGNYSSNVALKLLALYKHSEAAKSKAKATERTKDDDEVPREEFVETSGSGSDGDGAGHDRSQVVKKPGKENTKEKKNETRRADAGRANEIAAKLLPHVEHVLVEEESAAGVKQLFGDQGVRVVVAGPWINFFAQSPQHQGTRGTRKAKQQSEPDALSHSPPIPHQFEMEIRPSQFTEESYLLYRKYTIQIHAKEEASEKSYTDFLCSTPLFDDPQGREDEALPPSGGYGSFHQYYRLDGKLIAVGVLDVHSICVCLVVQVSHVGVLLLRSRLRVPVPRRLLCAEGDRVGAADQPHHPALPVLLHGVLHLRLPEDELQGQVSAV